MTLLDVRELSVSQGARFVIRDFSLKVQEGSFVVIAGENGAGKSTLLKSFSGQISPLSGRISFGGQKLREIPAANLARMRSFLAQQTECRLPFTVFEVVLLGAEAAGFRGADARSLVLESLRTAGVAPLRERVISELSGGEQQRVHWARSLAQMGRNAARHLLLLDEPVSSLDVAHQHQLLSTAHVLTRRGATVIAVLHDLNLVSRYADQIVLLNEGRAVHIGPPSEVLTPGIIREVFHFSARVIDNPVDQTRLILPELPAVLVSGFEGE